MGGDGKRRLDYDLVISEYNELKNKLISDSLSLDYQYDQFTSPLRDSTEGIVYASKPLIYNGTLIDKFWLKFENGKIVTADAVKEGNILVKDDKIAAVLDAGVEVEAEKVIDATGKMVFPGAIDTHAHLNDPGFEWREDYEHGTAAAALGGIGSGTEAGINKAYDYFVENYPTYQVYMTETI